jgi:nitroreductase
MNQTIETIFNRRSVRRYDAKPIPKDVLEQILKCGDAGPSGANNRAWRYVVVQDPRKTPKRPQRRTAIYPLMSLAGQ